MRHVVEPTIADTQLEHADALARGQRWRARWIQLSMCTMLARALALVGSRANGDWNGAVTVSSACMLLIALIFLMVNLSSVSAWATASPARLMVLLVPAAIALAFPVGFVVTLLYGLARGPASRRVVAVVLIAGMAASGASTVALGWIVPASNQEFREEALGRSVPKGANELTFPELRRSLRLTGSRIASSDDIALSYYTRAAFASAPLVLALFALAVVRRSRVHRLAFGAALLVGYFTYLFALETGGGRTWAAFVTPFTAAWIPNLAVVLIAALSTLSRLKPGPTA
jgi:hypothetical protein